MNKKNCNGKTKNNSQKVSQFVSYCSVVKNDGPSSNIS